MIKPAFISKQCDKSRREGSTSPFLRRLIFSTVDSVARQWYGPEVPVRCLQVSHACQHLLEGLGIRSHLWVGAVCVPGIYRDRSVCNWIGFWDEDHHFWLHTELGEIVDLNAMQLHLHPLSSRKDGVGMPALWWHGRCSPLPDVIRYLPDTMLPGVVFPDAEDQADLEGFIRAVREAWTHRLEREDVGDVRFGPILDGLGTLNDLVVARDPWALGARRFNDHEMGLPPWIEARTNELWESGRAGENPSSPLASVGVFSH